MGKKIRPSNRPRHSDPALVCDGVHIRHWWTRGDVNGEADREGSWEVSGTSLLGDPLCTVHNMPLSQLGSQKAAEFHSHRPAGETLMPGEQGEDIGHLRPRRSEAADSGLSCAGLCGLGYVRLYCPNRKRVGEKYPGFSPLTPSSPLPVPLSGQTQVEARNSRSLLGAVQEDQVPGFGVGQEGRAWLWGLAAETNGGGSAQRLEILPRPSVLVCFAKGRSSGSVLL